MSKAAMNQLTRNLACEYAPDNIRVNSVAPWYNLTELTDKVCGRRFVHVMHDLRWHPCL